MLLGRDLFDSTVIKINKRMTCLLDFTKEKNFVGLFARVRVKTDFLMKFPIVYFS